MWFFFKHCYPSIQNHYFSFKSSISLLFELAEYSSNPVCEEEKWATMSSLHDVKGHRLNSGTVKGNISSWEIKWYSKYLVSKNWYDYCQVQSEKMWVSKFVTWQWTRNNKPIWHLR